MAFSNINRVVLTGNLTHDPELRATSTGTPVCNLRIAASTQRKTTDGYKDKTNYFEVTLWGAQAENAVRFLAKGLAVAVDGKLDYQEWETADRSKRRGVQIIAEHIQYLTPPTPVVASNGNRQEIAA